MPHSKQSHPLMPLAGDQDAITWRGPRRCPFGQCVGAVSTVVPSARCTVGYPVPSMLGTVEPRYDNETQLSKGVTGRS